MAGRLSYQLLYSDSKAPTQADSGSNGLDLYVHSAEDCGNFIKTKLGIAIQPDIWTFTYLFPRSSIYKKGLMLYNSIGLIDNSYRGELMALFYKTADYKAEFFPKKDERLCQLVPVLTHVVELKQVLELGTSSRGTGGFGSSGV